MSGGFLALNSVFQIMPLDHSVKPWTIKSQKIGGRLFVASGPFERGKYDAAFNVIEDILWFAALDGLRQLFNDEFPDLAKQLFTGKIGRDRQPPICDA